MVDPPLSVGAVQVMVAVVLLVTAVAVPMVGALGVVKGMIPLESDEYDPVPAALVAAVLKVYDLPFVRPVKS